MREVVRVAPAKLNLTLEVLGRRPDQYHELRSVVTTLNLVDRVSVGAGHGFVVLADEDYDASAMPAGPNQRNSGEAALALLTGERVRRSGRPGLSTEAALQLGLSQVAVRLEKRIPAAAGLGGGSSDAAAVLHALTDYWSLPLGQRELEALALAIGSDTPFFVRGGVQLMAGRGEVLRPMPPPGQSWFCILVPPLLRQGKTTRMYALLREGCYSDGARSEGLARRLTSSPGWVLQPEDLCNVFDAVAGEAFGDLRMYRVALEDVGARAVHLCGAGPALYGLCDDAVHSLAAEAALRAAGHTAFAVSATDS